MMIFVLHVVELFLFFFFSSRRRHTRWPRDWSSDVCSSDLIDEAALADAAAAAEPDAERRQTLIQRIAKMTVAQRVRSEERRVGKECRTRLSRALKKKNIEKN